MAVQGKAVVPKFGSWDAENIGYTVFFEKVRENKTAPVPAPAPKGHDDYEFDPYEHYENLSRKAASRPPSSQGHGHPAPGERYYDDASSRNAPSRPASSQGHPAPAQHYYEDLGSRNAPSRPPSSQGHPAPGERYYEDLGSRNVPSRPPSSHGNGNGNGYGHPAPAQHYTGQHGNGGYHRRNGSNGSSAASEVSSRASKFSPPRPYQPRYGSNSGGSYHQPQPQPQQQQYAAPGPRHQHQHAAPAPRVAASPPRHAAPPANERRRPSQGVPQAPSAVPKFGVWDEQNAAQGFTVQFEKVQRQREVAKVAAPDVPPTQQFSPERAAPAWGRPVRKPKKSFLSKVYRCLFPVVRQ
uniref:Uncharacterized protein n=1 Tax=Avena sativa TaxID=4498 RepID=A0ACD5Z951_AVESA